MNRDTLARRIADAIDAGDALTPEARDALLADLRAYQAKHVVPYGRLVRGRGPEAAMPTDVFRFARVASHPAADDVRVFRTSGTTSGARGAHPFADLSLYDRAARAWASRMLLSCASSYSTPNEHDAPDSSLSYMLSRFETWFGTETTFCWKDGVLDVEGLRHALRTDEPVALLGTSFAFVFAGQRSNTRFALAPGSRVMQTGGFKGRTREVAPADMLSMLAARFGVGEDRVVAEYGMTELSSQAYETTLVAPSAPRRLRFPAWVRVTAVDPVSLAPRPTGETGLLRIDDAANLDSVCALQTADLARVDADGSFELFGRAPGATPRGCSLAVEEALS
ncbi:MAG: acyl-protein synthetase [Polyangiales bacterium]